MGPVHCVAADLHDIKMFMSNYTTRSNMEFKKFVYFASLITLIITITLNVLFLYYTNKLDKDGCKCAMRWERIFMMVSLIFFIALGLISTLYYLKLPIWLGLVNSIVIVSYLIITRKFINEMKRDKCKCATKNKIFKILDVYNIIQFAMLALSIFILICLIGVFVYVRMKYGV